MKGSVFRRCGCRNPDAKSKYEEGQCPKLISNKRADRNHGSWWGRYEAPRGANGKRRQVRIDPYDTRAEAESALAREVARVDSGGYVPDRKLTVSEYLTTWLEGKRNLKPSTWESYRECVELYFKPALGHLRLIDLRHHHISDMVTALLQINRPLPNGKGQSEMLRRMLEVRADDEHKKLPEGEKRRKKSTRPLTPARVKRVLAALNSALNTAVKQGSIDINPAAHVELPRVRKMKPVVWSPPRVARWRETGKVPSPVMVRTPPTDRRIPRLHRRRAPLRPVPPDGIPWPAARRGCRGPVGRGRPRQRAAEDPDGPKSESGARAISLDSGTVAVLRSWRARQTEERLACGDAWHDSGALFTRPDGQRLRPQWVSNRFDTLVARAKLPPIRLHDLRHGAATLSLAAGVDMKIVSDTLGHSKSSFTADVHTSVVPEVAGVRVDEHGFVPVDRHMATSVAGVMAAGDVTGLFPHTHAAYAMGRVAVGAALRRFRRPTFDTAAIPWVVFTSPEVATVGRTEGEVIDARARVAFLPMSEVDRAVTAARTAGFVQLIGGPRRLLGALGGGRILGATIVADRAGEMIHEPALVMRTGMFTGRLAQTVHAYPAWSLAVQQAAAQFFGGQDGRQATPANHTRA